MTLAALLLAAVPAFASGLPDFEAQLLAVRGAVLAQPFQLTQAKAPKPKLRKSSPRRVTDPETWARMLALARERPTLTQSLSVAGTEYKVSVVVSDKPAAGQSCAEGAVLRNALYVADAVKGEGGAVYPVRLASACVGPTLTHQDFMADADAQGLIQDCSIYDPKARRDLHPGQEPLTPAQLARFEAYLAELVKLFSAPR